MSSVRSKPRKDLAASFNRLRRMVGDMKNARKSLAAHHSFVAELVSVSLFPAVASSKGPPRQIIPSHHLQLDDLQDLGVGSMPLRSSISCSASPSSRPSQRLPINLEFDDLHDVGIGPALLQLDDLQEVGVSTTRVQSPTLCSVSPPSNLANPTLSSLRSKISALTAPLPPPSVQGSFAQVSYIAPSKLSSNINTNKKLADPSIAAHSGKLTAQSAFWASLLLAFLCFFLCIGKEVAVSVTITAYFVIWRIFKRRLIAKQPTGSTSPSSFHKVDSRPLNRSLTMPTYREGLFLLSSKSQLSTRSQSLPAFLGCLEEEEPYSNKPGFAIYSVASAASLCNTGVHRARLKLGVMLVLALCGLVHGQLMAVCACSCCILTFSVTQRLALGIFRQQ